MKFEIRRQFLLLLIILLFVNNRACSQQNETFYLPKPNPDRIILNVTEDPSTSIAINWRTDNSVSESFAEIILADADPRFVEKTSRSKAKTEQVNFESISANYHSLIFENLIPDSKYAYRVGQGEYWSEWFHFNTAGRSDEDFSFIYYGDVQTNIHSLWSRVIREAYSKAPNARLMIYAGDLINRANRDVEWGDWFQAGGFIHSMIPGFPSPGNHDHYEISEDANTISTFWRPQFNLPENGPLGLEETCYFSDVQGVRFISLNSHQAEESDEYLEKQRLWLDSVLYNNPNRWTCISFHHPVY